MNPNISTAYTFSLLSVVVGCADTSHPALLDPIAVHNESSVDDSKSLLLREGSDTFGVGIARISEPSAEVRLVIVEGTARFLDGSKSANVTTDHEGMVYLPRIVTTEMSSDSVLRVSSYGTDLGVLRVRVIAAQRWDRLEELMVQHPGALLRRGEDFVAVDESRIAAEADDRGERMAISGDSAPEVDQTIEKQSLCLRSFVGPGQVLWRFPNPWAHGYSVKTETQWPLIQAQASWQDIDGVYNRQWGCRRAYKVPDSCTMEVWQTPGGTNGNCCCNAAASALGHSCQWVDPTALSDPWPACPL